MDIDLCGFYGAVSQYLLNAAYVYSFFNQVCGEGMAKHVWSNMSVDSCQSGVFFQHEPDGLFCKAAPSSVYEEIP